MATESPLARDKFDRPVELPDNADAFQVYRVPTAKGGKPSSVQADGFPLEVPIDFTAEDLMTKLAKAGLKPGRYRLDVVDKDSERVKPPIQCWVTLEGNGGYETPAASSASEAALVELTKRLLDSFDKQGDTMAQMARAFSGAPAPARSLTASDDGSGETLKEVIENALAAQSEVREDDPEKTAKAVEVWTNVAMNVAAKVPTLGPLFDMLKAALKKDTPAAIAGAAVNGAAKP